jgi:hypothetical protein
MFPRGTMFGTRVFGGIAARDIGGTLENHFAFLKKVRHFSST